MQASLVLAFTSVDQPDHSPAPEGPGPTPRDLWTESVLGLAPPHTTTLRRGSGLVMVAPQDVTPDVLATCVSVLALATRRQIGVSCAVLAGNLVRIETTGQDVQYMGSTIERAEQLASIAPPGAVLVDSAAVVVLGLGAAGLDLLSPPRAATLGGDAEFAYHDVAWERYRPGMLSPPAPRPPSPPPAEAREPREPRVTSRPASNSAPVPAEDRLSRWLRGTIMRIGSKFGFIEDTEGQLYYFQQRNLTVETPLRRGMRVVFRSLPPARGTQEKRAEDVFVVDAFAEGVLERVNPKGWGLMKLECANGLDHRLFLPNVASRGLTAGQRVRCRIGVNDLGPLGYAPEIAPPPAPTPPAPVLSDSLVN